MSATEPAGEQESIAIIGMAGRFPDAPDLATFWRNVRDGVESIRLFPDEELLAAGTDPTLLAHPSFVKAGTILAGIEDFDAPLFGFLPGDAALLDPQQRVFLECAWEAFENAGYDPDRYAGAIGVYGGVGVNTYLPNNLLANRPALERAGAFQTMIANDKDYLTTRVAYKLNLKGPAVTVQTACSTSLVAIHQACQSLLGYGCDIALAGGVSFQTPQVRGYLHQDGMIYSPDGHCRAFDDRAAGTVVGSGAGIVVLKRLSEALADGDTVHAVIKGSAANNDGSGKVGYTAPSVNGQAEVIAMAQAVAGVDPESIGYIEAHGSGTHLGDPIEIAALTQAFRAGTDRVGYCAIGSVKTNIGHADAAAGVAGLIKTALALGHRRLPPSLHFERPNPNINFADSPFYVNVALAEWPAGDTPRRAGVSGFGIGGTNAHVILEEAPEALSEEPAREWQVLPLAARSVAALDRLAARLAAHLRAHPDVALADVAHTLQAGRRAFDQRRVVVARGPAEAATALEAAPPGCSFTARRGPSDRAVAFMFTGQGAQYVGMGRELYEREPVFRDAVDRCATLLEPHLGCDLRELLYPPAAEAEAATERLNNTALTQPALFTIEWALAQLWHSWGVEPAALIGHSIGEYVAACLAGVFALEDALAVVATRGRLMAAMPAGGMLAVPLPEEEVRPLLGDELAIAAINGPGTCVVAGPFAALDALAAQLAARGVEGRRLQTSHAFHSAMMDPILDVFEAEVRQVAPAVPQIPFVSNVTGTWITAEEATDPAYWARHLRGTVCFADGLRTIGATGELVLLEVGPGRTLATLAARQGEVVGKVVAIPSLRHPAEEADDVATMLAALGRLWLAGVPVDWTPLHGAERRRRVPLPTYPFERQRCWIDPLPAATGRADAPMTGPTPAGDPAPPARPTPAREATMPEPQTAAPPSRRERILAALAALLSDLSGIPADELDPAASFMELGFDSLFLTQASQAIRTKLGARVTFRQLLDATPTLSTLAAYLDEDLPADAFPPETPSAPTASPVGPASAGPIPAAAEPTAQPASMPVLPPAGRAADPPADTSAIERIMAQQLQVMAQQLSLLQGGVATAVPSTAVAIPSVLTVKGGAEPARPTAVPSGAKSFGPFRPLVRETGESLSPRQQAHLDALIARYSARTPESKRLAELHRPYLADPRAVSGFRLAWKEMVYPLTTTRSAGSRVWDADGNEYIDITMGFGAYLLGHMPPFIEEALREQLARGIEIGSQAPQAGEIARLFCEITGHERAAFCNTGSEAVMTAIRVARAVTGRTRIALFEGAYHGNFDEVLVRPGRGGAALPIAPGIPRSIVGDALVLPYGAPEALDLLREHAHELAAVLVEPVQSRRPELQPAEFLRALRQLTAEAGVAFIVDEMVTGFRAGPRGAQGWFGVEADLATYGKIVGGGLPIGILAGKAAYLDALDGGHWLFGDDSGPDANLTYFAGTMVKHPLALAAALAILGHLREEGPELQERLNARTARLAETVNDELARSGSPIRIVHFSSLFNFRFPPDAKYAELLFCHLRERGIFAWGGRNLFLTTAHTEEDLARIARAIVESVAELQRAGLLPGPPDGPDGPGNGHHSASPGTLAGKMVELASIGTGGTGGPGARQTPSGERPVALAPARPGVTTAPLTPGQREIWVATRMDEDAVCAHNESMVVHLHGKLRLEALREALQGLVDRHEALRATFPDGDQQEFAASLDLEVPLNDLVGLSLAEREARLAGLQGEEAGEPFDLVHGPLIRTRLIRLAPDHHALILTAHHIICDGWSLGVLLAELNPLYAARCAGVAPELPAPEPFGAYARSQTGAEATARAGTSEHYWLGQYADAVPILDLPTDRPRPALKTYRAGQEVLTIEPELVRELKRVGGRHGSTLFTTLLAAYGLLLHRSTGQDDLVVGISAAGQAQHERGATLVGHCISMLPLRLRPGAAESFATFLTTVRGVVMDALDHQDCSFGALVPKLPIARDPGRVPLVEATFNLDRAVDGASWPGLDVRIAGNTKRFFNFDLGFDIAQSGEELRLHCNYNADLFDTGTIRRLLGHYRTILEGIVADPTRRLADVPLLTTAEREQLLGWNATAADYPREATAHGLVAAQAARTPDAVAVTDGATSLTYAELDARANRLARHLRGLGVGPGALVAAALGRTPDLLVGLLGIFKAGGAYVPLDATYPADRLVHMLADSGAPVLLTEAALLPLLPVHEARVVLLDRDWPTIAAEPATDPGAIAFPGDLAYVIYTSGSTGLPKGVAIEHNALVNFLASMRREPGLAAGDTLLAVTTLSFDIAALELFLPLVVGARVVLVDREVAADGSRLAARLATSGATVFQATPATFRLLLDAGWAGQRDLTLLCGGEALPRDLADALLPRCAALWNMYGPTETTIWSAVSRVAAGIGPVPVGPPIANTYFRLLDAHRRPVPIGVAGELYIGGDGLARGYHNRPELTAERFVPDPFTEQPGARLYRTGDLARRRPDGQLEFLGRLDHQVKIRGFRIELGEIEAALAAHPAVREVVVMAREDAPGDRRLVAYLVAEGATPPAATELRHFLKASLPDYMIPAAFVPLEAFPLTPNGKVDRRALPAPQGGAGRSAAAPSDALELQLVALWEGVLGVQPVGLDDSFFDLGGHSLLAVRLFGEIERVFGRALPLATLFRAPTVGQLAEFLRRPEHAPPWSPLVLLAGGGDKPPFFVVHAVGGNVLNYRDLARGVGGDRPVYGLQALGLDGQQAPLTRVEEMAARYIAEIRRVQPVGPYYLGGQCFGGMVALEIAQQLQAADETVALLAMFDSDAPGYTKALPASRRTRIAAGWFARRARYHARQLAELPARTWLPYVGARGATVLRRGRSRIWGLAGRAFRHSNQPLPESLRNVREAGLLAQRDYAPRPYRGCPVLFVVDDPERPVVPGSQYGWEGLATGGVEIIEVPGEHRTMLHEPHVSILATRLRDCLARAERTM